MTTSLFYLYVGVALWLIGLQGVFLLRHLVRRIVAVNLMGSGVFLVLVALSARTEEGDPILQALVVTGLVVAVCATALAVRLATAQSPQRTEEPQ